MISSSEKGLYQQTDTILHRLDPRLKVLSSLTLVVLAFAAVNWWQLLLILALVVVPVLAVSSLYRPLIRILWMLRWFLLFTLLMHLLFSPGRVLWGVGWLSFDGLLSGTFVCMQMLLAVTASVLLASTTSTESLSHTFRWFVEPLRWFGCRTAEWQKIMQLAMDFVPVVHEEIRSSNAAANECPDDSAHFTNEGRITVWGQKLHAFILRLVNRGEVLAQRLAANEETAPEQNTLTVLLPLALLDKIFVMVVVFAILSYWLVS